MNKKEIVAQLIKNGAKSVKGVVVRNVTVTPQNEYVRLGLTLNEEVDGYRENETGEYELGKTNVIFVSTFAISSVLKDMDDAAFAANHLVNHPEAMGMILSRAKIDIVQQSVKANEEYRNPFASEDSETTTFDHDLIINHVVNIELSEFGIKRLDKLADKMLGF